MGVYQPAEVFYEDDVWKTFPSPNDRFAGWAKRMGELQAESYSIEYNWKNISIVRENYRIKFIKKKRNFYNP